MVEKGFTDGGRKQVLIMPCRDTSHVSLANRSLICNLNRFEKTQVLRLYTKRIMNNIITRKAETSDLDTLLSFEQGIITAERPFDSTLKEGEIHYYDLAKLIEDPNFAVIVAELDGEVIGSGYARITPSKDYLKHDRHCYLGFMYVKPEHRGKGVNKLVLEALKQWTKSQGINELRLEVYNDNQSAIKAYEKAGFTPNLLEMRMGI